MKRPFAHRGLHDAEAGRAENSLAACKAAIDKNFALEVDVQLSADGEAMAFHDDTLDRMTDESGHLRARTAAELQQIALKDGGGETIPTLAEVLELIAGRTPVVLEVKDQDGKFGPDVGPLEARVAELAMAYDGPIAVMSFNPHSVKAMGEAAPEVPRGLVSYHWPREDVPWMSAEVRRDLAAMTQFQKLGCVFVSYGIKSFPSRVAELVRIQRNPLLAWTVRTPLEEMRAQRHSDQITFEGYVPGRW